MADERGAPPPSAPLVPKHYYEDDMELSDLRNRSSIGSAEEALVAMEEAEEYEAAGICRGGCLAEPQTTALSALRARQLRLFSDAVCDPRFRLDHDYVEEGGDGVPRRILAVAVEQWRTRNDTPFVRVLLAAGADLCQVDSVTEVAPIHKVMRKGDLALLECCLPYVKEPNVQDGEGLTPLHALTEQLSEVDEPGRAPLLRMCEALLERCDGVEVNAEDLRGQLTPLYYAAAAGCREAAEMLLEHGADPEVQIEGSSIREVIEENIGKDFDFVAFADKVKSRPLKQRVFNCCESGDVNGLRRMVFSSSSKVKEHERPVWNCNNGSVTPLQLACTHGHDSVVAFLLEQSDCDPNLTGPGEGRAPVLIAAHHGYFKILDVMKRSPRVDFSSVENGTGKTVLHEVFRGDSGKHVGGLSVPNSSYPKSLKVLLGKSYAEKNPGFSRQITKIINYQESLDGDTALHYATMQADQEVIKQLLSRGANMGVKNHRDKPAVASILPETLREFLDERCIDGEGVITHEDFKVTFRYDFLAPPVLGPEEEEDVKVVVGEEAEREDDEKRALPETEALWYLSNASKEHRSLLKHPVIASFLWLKWQRIRTLFYVNMFLYLAFVVLLTAFIFVRFGGYSVQPTDVESKREVGGLLVQGENVNAADPALATALSLPIVGLLFVLVSRELFQMLVSFRRYFFDWENLLELTIIVLTCIIVFDGNSGSSHFGTNRHLAALCVLFSWTECLLMVGRHPRLSTNVTMLGTVVATFLRFLLWYGIIVVAFGIAFYIMMHTDHAGAQPNEEYPFFDRIWLALFKTSAMFVGELEFADIPFTDNVVSYLVFLLFIFLVVVVLMNLLNGLAVSDTGLIREEAEVVGWSARVDLITYTESMLLGDPFYFLSNWPPIKLLQRIPNCAVCRFLYKYPRVRDVLQKISGGTKILLFYTCLPRRTASFYPNRKSSRSILRYKKSLKVDDDKGGQGQQQQKLFISNDVLDSAKTVLLERLKADREESARKAEQEEVANRLLLIEEMLLQMQRGHQQQQHQ